MSDERLAFPRPELRRRTARGAIVNGLFLGGAEALVLVQGLIVTVLLGPSAIGLYGIVTTTAMTIVALKRVGIDEAFVQQSEEGQEEEFQRAFTLELALSAAFALTIAISAPIVAAAYADDRPLPPPPPAPPPPPPLRRRVPAARVRAAGSHVDLLPSHGLREAAPAAGDRAGGHLLHHGAARGRRRRRVVARDRAVRGKRRGLHRGDRGVALPPQAPLRRGRAPPLLRLQLADLRERCGA